MEVISVIVDFKSNTLDKTILNIFWTFMECEAELCIVYGVYGVYECTSVRVYECMSVRVYECMSV